MTIAALFVEPGGVYSDIPYVDVWDEERDARFYNGPYPVVAHPPCARWCRLSGFTEKRFGLKQGEDYGCFESALYSVKRFGGVIEHPAFSNAWTQFGLPIPNSKSIGWQKGIDGSWVCYVEQGNYGHEVKKGTWLYSYGCENLPSLDWSRFNGLCDTAWSNNNARKGRKLLSKRKRIETPEDFRDILIFIAATSILC